MKQTMFYSDDELSLIKAVFGGESLALDALRNLFLQFELIKEEAKALKNLSEETLAVIKKTFLPEWNREEPLFQQRSMYSSLIKVREYNFEPSMFHIHANDILIDYVKQQLNCLEGKEDNRIILQDLPKPMGCDQDELRFINILAYHNICIYIEGRINELTGLANPPKEETEEEKKLREAKNSTK